MGVLISADGIVNDAWVRLDDDTAFDNGSRIILSANRLRRDWAQLQSSAVSLGVEMEVTDFIEEYEEYLDRLELIVLRFDSFADGRAFSQARLLRERYGYAGSIRASGEVLRDQLAFMQRCGFDQFELAAGEEIDFALAAFSDISRNYQPEPAHRRV